MPVAEHDLVLSTRASSARLAAVRATGLLDSPTEESFDRLTGLAAKLTGAPVTFISLVAEDRDFYKSCFGFPEPLATERALSGTTFCHYALVSNGPLVIPDTMEDPQYRNVPTVESLGVRSYLGVPLVGSSGQAIGSFCAIDFKPRQWTSLDVQVMESLAASTLREIELRMALRTLDEERRRLAVLLEHIPAGVTFAEAPSGRIVMGNRRAREIRGELLVDDSSGSVSASWVGFRADGRRVEPHEWPIVRSLAGEVVHEEEILFERADGRRVWLRMDAAPVRDSDAAIIGGIVSFNDIDEQRALATENVRLYREAEQANRAKDDFFAAVSHELRTPMTAIIGWARLLRMEGGLSDDAAEAIDAITSSARLQAQLVDDLLDVSRISTGKLSLQRELLTLTSEVQEAVHSAQPGAESKGLSLRYAAGADGAIDADRGRIRQIIGNLLSNSMKFTPAGGLIEVSSEAKEGQATIVIRDTGRGIEPALLPHIFDRYRQATSAEMGGLGLGLAIVRHLVELHGGEVTAESEGVGKGATFTIRLPLATPADR
jgi:signal transduction histidine kinase